MFVPRLVSLGFSSSCEKSFALLTYLQETRRASYVSKCGTLWAVLAREKKWERGLFSYCCKEGQEIKKNFFLSTHFAFHFASSQYYCSLIQLLFFLSIPLELSSFYYFRVPLYPVVVGGTGLLSQWQLPGCCCSSERARAPILWSRSQFQRGMSPESGMRRAKKRQTRRGNRIICDRSVDNIQCVFWTYFSSFILGRVYTNKGKWMDGKKAV